MNLPVRVSRNHARLPETHLLARILRQPAELGDDAHGGGVGDVGDDQLTGAVVVVIETIDGGAAGDVDGVGVVEGGAGDVALRWPEESVVGGEKGAEELGRGGVGGIDGEELAVGASQAAGAIDVGTGGHEGDVADEGGLPG